MFPAARSSFLRGVRDVTPILISFIPFGLISGVAAVSVGIPDLPAFAMAFVIYAGAAQVAAVELIGLSAPIWIIWLSTFMINLRMVMYSASLAPYAKSMSHPWRALVAYLLTDPAFALSIRRFQDNTVSMPRWYYLGVAAPIWLNWTVSSATGVFIGAQLPESLGLSFAVPLIFMAMIFPAVTDRPSAAAALVGGLVAALAYSLRNNVWLVIGALAGIAVGVVLEGRGET